MYEVVMMPYPADPSGNPAVQNQGYYPYAGQPGQQTYAVGYPGQQPALYQTNSAPVDSPNMAPVLPQGQPVAKAEET